MTEQYQNDPFAAMPHVGAPSGSTTPDPNTAAPAAYAAAPIPPAAYPQGPYGPGMPAYVGQTPTEKNWMGITALVLSLSFLVVGILGSIPAIVFGHLGLSAVKRGEANNRGLALAGVIIGYVGLGLTVLGVIAYIVFIGWIITLDSGTGMYAAA